MFPQYIFLEPLILLLPILHVNMMTSSNGNIPRYWPVVRGIHYWISICQVDDDVTKWKHFPRYWPFERGIHRSSVNSPHKCQWHGALMFFSICAWINGWVNNREAGDLRRHRAHYDVTIMIFFMIVAQQRNYCLSIEKWKGIPIHNS